MSRITTRRAPPVVMQALRPATRFIWAMSGIYILCLAAMLMVTKIRASLPMYMAGAALIFLLAAISIGFSIRGFRRARALYRRARARDGAMCTHCAYELPLDLEDGTCPECGAAYTLANLRESWRVAPGGA